MRAASVPLPPALPRDLRLDFFRGLALICIFIDHIPENYLNYFTISAIGFFDAAEVFIFISGFTAALVYGRALAVRGVLIATVQVLRRAWQLYVAHIFLFVIFIAEVSYTVRAFNNPMYNEEMGVGDFLERPHIAVVQALLLQFQPTFLDILPLYIVMLLIFPAVLVCLRRHPMVALIPSALIYLEVQIFDVDMPAYPPGSVWTFNPLAWQFLFVLGAVLGHADTRSSGRAKLLALAYWPALAIAALALVIRLSWTFHGIWDAVPALFQHQLWPINKGNLSPIRLISFFALVMLAARWVAPQARFMRTTLAWPLVLCGRHSLEIFCLSILLSALGHFLMSEINTGFTMQLGVNVVGITVLCLTAGMLDWYRAVQQMPATTAQAMSEGSGGEA
ncbi:MAG TPA: OpgC domain-containing protein [Stellaceae bacterium]|nr:OpgC domain-containing protein [Stellaceae bacterium]